MTSLQPLVILADSGQPPTWWQATAGILAIPASFIGLAYSWVLIRKTRLEARKTELEIREKEQAQAQAQAQQAPDVQPLSRPSLAAPAIDLQALELQRAQQVFLRVILIFVVLQAWGLAETLYQLLIRGVGIGMSLTSIDTAADAIQVIAFIFFRLLQSIPHVGYWIVLIGLGWPVLTDTLDLLKFKVPRWLRNDKLVRISMVVATAVVVVNDFFHAT